jgi:uncharacterized BrkB/YihY/UPF0761 family membrane protein
MMNTNTLRKLWLGCMLALLPLMPGTSLAFDSYRYLHVTIDTIWYIFVFLLFILLVPFILMATLYWWTLRQRRHERARSESEPEPK